MERVNYKNISNEVKEKLSNKGFKVQGDKMFCQMRIGNVILNKEFKFDTLVIWNNKYIEFRLNGKNVMTTSQEIEI